MSRCEDWPCCGHELGCCPDFDDDGRQMNMKCVCGATVALGSRTSLCRSCLNDDYDDEPSDRYRDYEDDDGDGWADDEYAGDSEDSWLDGSYED